MAQVEIADADLRSLIERARGGEDVTVAESGRAIARIISLDEAPTRKEPRTLGLLAGKIRLSDDFDAPLPDELLDLFEGDPAAVERDRSRLTRGTEET